MGIKYKSRYSTIITNAQKELFKSYIEKCRSELGGGNIADILDGEENTEVLFEDERFRIERIISNGSFTEKGIWYRQISGELVYILQGQGELELDGGVKVLLDENDDFFIPPSLKHRVAYTSSNPHCIWLCMHIF